MSNFILRFVRSLHAKALPASELDWPLNLVLKWPMLVALTSAFSCFFFHLLFRLHIFRSVVVAVSTFEPNLPYSSLTSRLYDITLDITWLVTGCGTFLFMVFSDSLPSTQIILPSKDTYFVFKYVPEFDTFTRTACSISTCTISHHSLCKPIKKRNSIISCCHAVKSSSINCNFLGRNFIGFFKICICYNFYISFSK